MNPKIDSESKTTNRQKNASRATAKESRNSSKFETEKPTLQRVRRLRPTIQDLIDLRNPRCKTTHRDRTLRNVVTDIQVVHNFKISRKPRTRRTTIEEIRKQPKSLKPMIQTKSTDI